VSPNPLATQTRAATGNFRANPRDLQATWHEYWHDWMRLLAARGGGPHGSLSDVCSDRSALRSRALYRARYRTRGGDLYDEPRLARHPRRTGISCSTASPVIPRRHGAPTTPYVGGSYALMEASYSA
jgi:hypothetical protein